MKQFRPNFISKHMQNNPLFRNNEINAKFYRSDLRIKSRTFMCALFFVVHHILTASMRHRLAPNLILPHKLVNIRISAW